MAKASMTMLATVLLPLLSACDGSGAAATARPESGYATGTVVDTRGNPIAGAKILLDNTVFYASYINGSTAEDGSYRLKVQPGAWRAYATIRKDYNGRTYSLDLHPDSIDSFDDSGAVRNFTWKLEGRKPDSEWGYYGGLVKVFNETGFYEMEDVEITLEPEGPLIDGSEGRTLVLRPGDNYWRQLAYLEDIPIGRYTASAVLMDGESRQPLKLRDWDTEEEPAENMQLEFIPDSSGSPDSTATIAIGY
ncbi:carboxypeptidase-like regulatory domain-containing protein [Luteimonas dalianensis]|uniref:carboxypeptidase-like regulatory domain-containing protein n=1 Tax=Luteimonas dalianensis TaxID=1148196 RepID=UPI003BF45C37